jgi:hypothetical protein
MTREASVSLNFLPLQPAEFSVLIYARKLARPDEPKATDTFHYDLPEPEGPGEAAGQYVTHEISFEPRSGFRTRIVPSRANNKLTCRYLCTLLRRACEAKLRAEQYEVRQSFDQRTSFVLERFPEGRQAIWLSPYLLRAKGRFGFLIDFQFLLNPDAKFNRRVQQLSLSLDSRNRDNSNFYVDRFQKIRLFLKHYAGQLFPLADGGGESLDIGRSLERLPAKSLKEKVFIFGDRKSSGSQFMGVKEHGPLQPAAERTLLCFIYKEPDRPLSHDLFRALRGDTFATFPGMEKMFGFQLDKAHVQGLPVQGFTSRDFEESVKLLDKSRGGRVVVPIVLVPWSRHDGTDSDDDYYGLKHLFLSHNLPSQFVCMRTIEDANALKWSVSNIGLGIFSKLGGQPWKVKPQHAKCLIIGVGQAHELDERRRITRHFAYSVLTDSSGLYSDLSILSRAINEEDYLATLADKLKAVFRDYSERGYERFAVHATFSLRNNEMAAINDSIGDFAREEGGTREFVVLKFDDESKYFGYDELANSMVPYEGTYAKLSKTDFLVWFEGLQKKRPNVAGRIGRPVHIEFRYPARDSLDEEQMKGYVQDAINLSGANWRGFNAKSLPVSVYYAKLIATYFREFHRMGLPEFDLEHLTPWFL